MFVECRGKLSTLLEKQYDGGNTGLTLRKPWLYCWLTNWLCYSVSPSVQRGYSTDEKHYPADRYYYYYWLPPLLLSGTFTNVPYLLSHMKFGSQSLTWSRALTSYCWSVKYNRWSVLYKLANILLHAKMYLVLYVLVLNRLELSIIIILFIVVDPHGLKR